VAAALLERALPSRTFLNINCPRGAIKGVRVTVQAKRNHITKVDQRLDPVIVRITGSRKRKTTGTGRTSDRSDSGWLRVRDAAPPDYRLSALGRLMN
jgi:broad specificity polyphosphatase/5'/3'-nucleotidase SurE